MNQPTYLKIFCVVSAYWLVSISLVFLNKWLLSSQSVSLNAPLFITWFQCVVTAMLCYLMSYAAQLLPDRISFPMISPSFATLLSVLPLSIVFVLMVTFNNLSLKYLNVSFYFLARSMTTVFNVTLTFLVLGNKTSFRALLCCAVIVIGYGFGLFEEGSLGSLSAMGALFGIAASFTCALTSILTAKLLPKVNDSVWLLTFYNNVNASILFLPGILLNREFPRLLEFPLRLSPWFWFLMFVSGVFGFAIGYVGALQIQVTSPLTHNVSGTAKAAAQTVLAVVIFSEIKSIPWWASNALVLFGSAAYAYVRHLEGVARSAKSLISTEKLVEFPAAKQPLLLDLENEGKN